ncbi:putative ribonuclease H-like domain-containing protein [Tanacetum coccineum]|uniref:Ribonuclease H-like domain-containing protein n=1 Tax=Tanacetum coccineum TaxID=301880 RepID=A0ABQ5BL20_9ASTR
MEPKKVTQALDDESWVEAMQEEQEEGVDYDEVFAPVARIEAIRLFLAYASYMDFIVYQMDVKSAFLYGTIEEEVYVSQPTGFVDPKFPNRVYKVEKALYGLHQAPRAWYETLSTYLLENGFRRGTIDKTLFIKKIKNDILIVQVYVDDIIFGSTKKSLSTDQDKYVYDILKKFGFSSVKTTSTPMETHKPLSKDANGTDVDVHWYRSMIGSLMYLTSSRPDIMFAVCACSRFQVQPKASYMHAVRRIFRYLKGQPTLGLWYPKDSPLELISYSDSDYACASLDRKSTTGGCQFLGCRLISWQCKKQTIVANSTTEAEYIAASNCCGHNPVYHSKTKHIEIRHHFIRDSYEKKLIEMVKIHTDYNVADLLTKAFDLTRFQFLIASIDFRQKPTGSAEFHQIVDFLASSHIRRHLQLADANGNSSLPNTEIFEQLTLMGPTPTVESQHTPIVFPTTSQPTTSQQMSSQEHPSHEPTTEPINTTSSPSLTETTIPQTTSSMPYDSPLSRGDTLGSDEGSKKLNELTELCTKLFDKVISLEKDLNQTKKVYGKALTKLAKKVNDRAGFTP